MAEPWRCTECGSEKKSSYRSVCNRCYVRLKVAKSVQGGWRCEECGSEKKSSFRSVCRRCYIKLGAAKAAKGGWRCEECGSEKKSSYGSVCRNCYKKRRRREGFVNKVADRLRTRRCLARAKFRIVEELGGRCACCGEDRLEFLTVDHVNGDGAEHKRKLGSHRPSKSTGPYEVYSCIKKQGYPRDKYRVLCFNCNCSIGVWGYCGHHRPHDRKYPYVLGMEPVLE
jgi:hypothetical protein